MKNVVLIIISICLFNLSLMAENKTLDNMLEKHKGKEGISEIKELVDRGINAEDNNGNTALYLASKKGYGDIVDALIKAQAEINTQDHTGWTALMIASARGYISVVKVLIEAGADLNLYGSVYTDYEKQNGKWVKIDYELDLEMSALDLALVNEYIEIVELLKKAGAK